MSKEKIDSFSASSENGFTRLVGLGVEPAVLNASGLEEEDYQVIYLLLSPIASKFPFSITQSWQLQALTGKLCFYKTIPIEARDSSGAQLGHYAAWSGSKDALDYIKATAPYLLEIKDNLDRGIVQYSVLSKNTLSLDWINTHAPQLLEQKDNQGHSITYSATLFGNILVLDWIYIHAPQLLEQKDNKGHSMAHYAAHKGNVHILDWIDAKVPQLLEQKDGDGRSIAHSAAQNNNIHILDWIDVKVPRLLVQKNNFGRSIAFAAAWSDSLCSLDWINAKVPQLLKKKDDDGRSIAHSAVRLGYIPVLNWINAKVPSLLKEADNNGRTLAHEAAKNEDAHALDWINANVPDLLTKKDSFGLTFIHRAAIEGGPNSFNRALHYTKTPCAFFFKNMNSKRLVRKLLEGLNHVLDSNFSLKDVEFPAVPEVDNLVLEIIQKVSRNKAIPRAMDAFSALMLTVYLSRNQVTQDIEPIELPNELWSLLLTHVLPEGIPNPVIDQLLGRAFKAVNQAIEKSASLSNRIEEKIDVEIARLEDSFQNTHWLIDSSEDKINRLNELKNRLHNLPEHALSTQLQATVASWLQDNQLQMNVPRNRLCGFSFFDFRHKTKAYIFTETIKRELGITLSSS